MEGWILDAKEGAHLPRGVLRENVDSALRENDGSAALGLEAAAGDLMVVEDGPRREPEVEGEGRGDSVLAAFAV